MHENDAAPIHPRDPLTALALLTRLPVPPGDEDRQADAAWAYPIVGLVVGALAALVGGLAAWLGLPAPVCALLALAALVVTTGAMHEDGLADMADGFWGGWDRQARLQIMRDSRIGTYGVLALCLGLGARWSALWLLYEAGPGVAAASLLAAAALSRAAMPVLMATLPHARDDGLARRVGHVSARMAALGAAIAGIAALILLGGAAIWAMLWAGLATFGIARLARRKIGGQTGDILGAAQQIAEIAVLFVLLA